MVTGLGLGRRSKTAIKFVAIAASCTIQTANLEEGPPATAPGITSELLFTDRAAPCTDYSYRGTSQPERIVIAEVS